MFEAVGPYFGHLMFGVWLTLLVSIGSFVIGFVIALACAPLSLSGSRTMRLGINIYVTVIRGLPELLVIFLVFYGGTVLLTKLSGQYFEVNALSAGISALAFVSGAYLTEILRAALLSIPKGQWEAAKTLGLNKRTTFAHIVFPQMLKLALPGLGNQWLIVLKESALVSIVGLEELMRKSIVGAGATHEPLAFYLTAAMLYVLMSTISSGLFSLVEYRVSAHDR